MTTRASAWYPDPIHHGSLRWFDGDDWTTWVSAGSAREQDPTPLAVVRAAAVKADGDVVRDYLVGATARQVIGTGIARRIEQDLAGLEASAAATAAATGTVEPAPARQATQVATQAAPRPTTVPAQARTTTTAPAAPEHAAPRPAPRPVEPAAPGPVAVWWQRTRATVVSDLAVHGLAYLGVAMLFAGVVGLIAFSSGDVDPAWRGVADAVAPAAFFLAAWFLRRRRATAVAAALTVLGGAVLPIAAVASLTDGSSMPPDVHGVALPMVQAVVCGAIAAAMWWWSARTPATPLRWVAPPTAWLAVGLLAGLLRDPIPTGEAVVRAEAVQLALMLSAVAVTMLAATWRPHHPTASPVMVMGPFAAIGLLLLEAVAAGADGWPWASGVIAAASALVVAEVSSRRTAPWTGAVETVLVGLALLRLAPVVAGEWRAVVAVGAFLTLAEWNGRRRPTATTPLASGAPVLAALVAAAASLAHPTPGLVGMVIVGGWGLWRRWAPPSWLPWRDTFGVVPATASAGMLAMGWWLTSATTALLVGATAVALVAGAGTAIAVWRRDVLWRWWVPIAAGVMVLGTVSVPWSDDRLEVACIALLAAIGLGLSPALRTTGRTWAASAAGLWSVAAVAAAIGVDVEWQAAIGALVALGLISAASAVDHPVIRHLGAFGHLLAIGMLVMLRDGGSLAAVVVGLFTAGWVVVAVFDERTVAHHLDHLAEAVDEWVRTVPALVGWLGLTATSMLALDAAGAVALTSPWTAMCPAVAATVVAASSWHTWRRTDVRALAVLAAGLGAGSLALAGAPDPARWPMIATLAAGIATSALLIRHSPVAYWAAWALSVPLVVLVVESMGVDTRWNDLTVAVWCSVMVIGAVGVDRMRHLPGWTLAPAVLGVVGAASGAVAATIGESAATSGWIAIGMAAAVLVVALVRPVAALSGVSIALLTVGVPAVVPWSLEDRPWAFVGWAAVLAATAWVVRPRTARAPVDRWDLPPFVGAHVVALVAAALAVGLAPDTDVIAITYLSLACLSAVIAVVLRGAPWAVATPILAVVGAAAAGPGWLALALLVVSVAVTVVALRRRLDVVRRVEFVLGAASAWASWTAFAVWQDISLTAAGIVPAVAGALVALTAAVALRLRAVPTDAAAVWSVAGAAGVLGSLLFVPQVSIDRALCGGIVAVAVGVLAMAAVVAAPVEPRLRWVASALALTALVEARWAAGLTPTPTVAWATALALVATVVGVALHAGRATSPWRWPVLALAAAVQFVGLAALSGAGGMPSTTVAVVLLALAGEAAGVALVSGNRSLFLLTPTFAVSAWLVVAADAARGEPNWFTVPIGVTMLVLVSMVRSTRRTERGAVRSGEVNGAIVAAEYVAMSVIVVPPLVQTVTEALWFALLAIGFGVAIAVWGAVSQVRRRAAFGAGATGVAILTVIGVPIADVVPDMSGPALWLTIAGVGALAIVVATLLEQGKGTVRRIAEVMDDITADWERSDQADPAPAGTPSPRTRPPRATPGGAALH